ncbi:MAG: response regulator, partial [Gemmatimonadaceae bacterium]
GVASYLTKPVRQSVLLEAVLEILSISGEQRTMTQPVAPEDMVQEPVGLRVLVAEDNAVNRRVVESILKKRGHTVVLVENGLLAVEAVQNGTFDVVLMDVQMPDMDGHEATAAIRKFEKDSGQHVPIIALTAHAMTGDREECLAVGMDGYLSKPVHAVELFAAIGELVKVSGVRPPSDEIFPVVEADTVAFDTVGALDRLEGDSELLNELAEIFRGESDRMLQDVRLSVESGDAPAVCRSAHVLKGSASSIGGDAVATVAKTLEAMGREAQLDGALTQLRVLERELSRLNTEIIRFSQAA